ncbi:MAG: ATP-grasp domain-containing protein [Planctomycetota bacterium]|nr:ATP-grasp domain-containing protein [Planctomycetota bacterium]
MKKLRVLVLMHAELVPPESVEGLSEKQVWSFEMELAVRDTLRELGHDVRQLGVEEELRPIREQIRDFKPHIAFNIINYFHNVTAYDSHVVSYLELLKQPYTGCNPRGIVLAGDKALSKKILSYHRIPVPLFAVFPQRRRARKLPARMHFPAIIKSAVEHGSTGISQASIVHDDKSLRERVEFIHRTIGTDAIAEQYIEGRELTVSVLGNERLDVFPVWELWYENLPERNEAIATSRVKWDPEYQDKIGVRNGPARDLDPQLATKIQHIAKRTYRALDLSGFARIDMRMDADGRVYVIEANCNPDLTPNEDFAESAKLAGTDYSHLLQRIVNLGINYKSLWKIE